MTDRARALFLFSDTGGGHRSAAEAIIEALELQYPGAFDIQLIDFFKSYAPRPLKWAPEAYPEMARHARAWGFGYRAFNSHTRARALTSAFWPYVRRAARRLVRDHPADIIVSVHPVCIAPVMRALGPNRQPFVTVVTDLVSTHALWYHRRVDRCLVPTERAQQRGLDCGMTPDQLRVTGLPVARRFCQPTGDTAAFRRQLGWPLDRPMVLLVGGGEGMGPLYETAATISAGGGNFGLAVISGRNQRLRQQLEARAWDVPTFIYGFERRMPELMRAASILVTKAGPGTITEAINAGLPMVLFGRLPGQEEGNVDYVVEEGVGLWAPGPERTGEAVRRWLGQPGQIERAAAACRRVSRPEAAMEVAREIACLQASGPVHTARGARLTSALGERIRRIRG